MKIKEVRELSTEELNNQVYSLKEQLFNLRRKKAVGNLDNMLELKRVRKDIGSKSVGKGLFIPSRSDG